MQVGLLSAGWRAYLASQYVWPGWDNSPEDEVAQIYWSLGTYNVPLNLISNILEMNDVEMH